MPVIGDLEGHKVVVGTMPEDSSTRLALHPEAQREVGVIDRQISLGADLVAVELKRYLVIYRSVVEHTCDDEVIILGEITLADVLVEAEVDIIGGRKDAGIGLHLA